MGQFGCSGGGDRAGLTPSRQVLVNRVGASGAQTLAHRPNGRLLPLNSEAWYRLRRSVLAEQPLCPECEARGVIEPATQVHHINDNAMDNSRSNLVGLCASCHSRHTAHDMGKRVNHGCDVSGWPANPSSHWNQSTVEAAKGLAGDVVGDSQKSPAAEGSEPTGSPSFNADCLKNRQL